MSCRHPLLVPTFQSYFLSCNHPTLSSTLFPHSQYQNISTLPISKYFHTPNFKTIPHSQYQNISKLTISKYFHNLNIKLFPHCQNRYIFTLLRNLIHTISNIKYPTVNIFIQILIWISEKWTILYISWYVDRPEYWPMTSYWPPHDWPHDPKILMSGQFCTLLMFLLLFSISLLCLSFNVVFGVVPYFVWRLNVLVCAGWPTSFIPGKWTVKIPIGGQIQILTTEHAQHTKFHKRNV